MMLKPKSKRAAWLKALYLVPVALVSLAMTAKTVVDYETIPPEDTSAVRVFTDQRRGDAYQIRHQPGVRFFRNGVEEKIAEGRSIALEVSKTTLHVNGKPVDQATLPDITTGTLKEIRLTELESDKFVCNMVTEAPKGKTVYIVDGKETTEEEVSKLRNEDIVFVDVIGSRESVKALNVEADKAVIIQTKQQGDDKIFDICEQLPSFPGGEAELMGFIAKNIKYPEAATKYGVQGRVIVQFIVEKDGSLSNVKVLENPKKSDANMVVVTAMMPEKERQDAEGHNAGVQAIRDEAIRVVKAMPKWTPAKQRGKAVRSRFTIPVTYRLN